MTVLETRRLALVELTTNDACHLEKLGFSFERMARLADDEPEIKVFVSEVSLVEVAVRGRT